MGKVMRHTLGASLNIRHNLSSSKGPKPLQLKLLTTYIPKTSAFTLAFSTSQRLRTTRASAIFFFQAKDGIRPFHVTGVQTCALPISCADLEPRPRRRHQARAHAGDAHRHRLRAGRVLDRLIDGKPARHGVRHDQPVVAARQDRLGDLPPVLPPRKPPVAQAVEATLKLQARFLPAAGFLVPPLLGQRGRAGEQSVTCELVMGEERVAEAAGDGGGGEHLSGPRALAAQPLLEPRIRVGRGGKADLRFAVVIDGPAHVRVIGHRALEAERGAALQEQPVHQTAPIAAYAAFSIAGAAACAAFSIAGAAGRSSMSWASIALILGSARRALTSMPTALITSFSTAAMALASLASIVPLARPLEALRRKRMVSASTGVFTS